MTDPRVSPARPVEQITFNVSDVPIPDELLYAISYRDSVEFAVTLPLEACADSAKTFVFYSGPGFLNAAHLAFTHHYPLVLSPDHLWLLIVQGFARHVQMKAEVLRPRLVEHQGQMMLQVVRPDFKKGAPDNAWEQVFPEFSRQIQAHMKGDFYDLLIGNFSTTGALEKAAFEIGLMDTFQRYFTYGMTWCGIPSITLEGSPADWRSILERARKLRDYDLAWWIDPLLPILEELVRTSEGQINVPFWQSFYKDKDQSGSRFITGWLLKFFPYICVSVEQTSAFRAVTEMAPNPVLSSTLTELAELSMRELGSGLSMAPVTWECPDKTYDMEFIAGFMGVAQDQVTKALRPEIGWAVCEVLQPRAR